jgi:hypothetical protein
VLDPYPAVGNASMFINDYRYNPHAKRSRAQCRDDRKVNVTFLHVTYKGWPYIFIKASGDINHTAEFILVYGNGYWTDSVKLHNSFQYVQPPVERLQSLVDKVINPSINRAAAVAASAVH